MAEFSQQKEVIIITPPSDMDDIQPSPMDNISAIMAPMTVSSALLFTGKLDIHRFVEAIKYTVKVCPWLVCAYEQASPADQINLIPRKVNVSELKEGETQEKYGSKGFTTCEYDVSNADKEYSSAVAPMNDLLPSNIQIKMIRVDLALASVDELSIAAFKVSTFANHFVIGYRLNHAFFDQASIVYLFQFLSNVYNTHGNPTMKPPTLKFRASVVGENEAFVSDEEFVSAAPKGYTADPMPPLSFGVPGGVEITFNTDKVESLKASSSQPISTNDILHAILLKALARYTLEQKQDGQEPLHNRLLFARNMRKPLGFGSETVGDYIRLECLGVDSKDASDTCSILELAEKNRQLINQQVDGVYPRECLWFLHFNKYRAGRPNSDFIMDKQACVVTNWSTFPYEEIKFDQSEPEELLIESVPAMTATGGFVRVSFRGKGDQRKIISVVNSLEPGFLEQIRKVGEETALFNAV